MGLKLRSHPLAVAIAQEQFEKLDDVLEQRRKYATYIMNELKDLQGISFPNFESDVEPSWYAMVMMFNSEELDGLSRDLFVEALVAEGCLEVDIPNSTSPLNLLEIFKTPNVLFPNYKGEFSYEEGDFLKAEKFYRQAIKIPIWHNQKDEKIVQGYVKAFKKVIINYKELLQ